MRATRKFVLRLRSLLQPTLIERELDAELQFHLDQATAEKIAAGMDPIEARSAAQRGFGNLSLNKEDCRDMRRVNLIENLFHDLHFGMRMLRKSPAFTLIALLTLAIGIGANTAIFSFVDAILFRSPDVGDPNKLLSVFTVVGNDRRSSTSYPDFQTLATASRKLDGFAAYSRIPLNWIGSQQSEVIWGEAATANFFHTMQVAPMIGHTFDTQDLNAPVVVLEYRFWHDRWNSDPGVLGRSMRIGSRSYTIVGVMPEGFRGTSTTFAPALWLPLQAWNGLTPDELQQPARRWLDIVARPANGATVPEAKAELATLSKHLNPIPNRPEENRKLVPLTGREARTSGDRTAVFIVTILFFVVSIVLLVASSNVASLLLTRTVARRKEIALRQSLGASQPRIIRQLLTEGLLLAGLGAVGGAILARWALRFLGTYQIPSPVPILFDFRLDTRALLFTTLAAVVTSLLFGLMPALEAARTDLIGRIRQQRRVRNGLDLMVAIQVAGGVVLLTGASLFVAATGRAARIDPGFIPNHAVAITVDPSLMGMSREPATVFYRQLLDAARSIPGVQSVGLAQNIPLGTLQAPVNIMSQGQLLRSRYNVVDGDFFPAIGTRLIRGRPFSASSDTLASTPVIIINELLAKILFNGQDAIGQRVCLAGPPEDCRQVIAIGEQGKYATLSADPAPYFWIPFSQRFQAQMTLIIRTAGESSGYMGALRRQVASLEPSMPVIEEKTIEEHMRIPLLEPRIPSFFLTVLSVIGLVLSVAGIIGTTAYAVSSRTKEIGIRMAIGARRIDVLAVVLKRAMVVVALAVIIGIFASIGFGKLVGSLLYGLNPAGPIRLAVVAAVMSIAMLIGSFIPAYTATKVDPAITLREE